MDALKIIEIKNAYKAGNMSFEDASFELAMMGMTADEVIAVLND